MPGSSLPAEVRRAVSACLLPGFPGITPPAFLRAAIADGLGGVCLFAGNIASPAALSELTAELRAQNPALLVAIDEEGGDVTRLDAGAGSDSPGNWALGAVDDLTATQRIAATIGGRLGAVGVNLNLAPDADVNNNPLNPVIGIRSFGADPELVSRHVAAYVAGLQSRRVAACAKHFPGHGDTSADSHHELPVVAVSRERLDEVELPPFRAAIAAGVRVIMTAHLVVPALDPDRPATVSPAVLRLLREELGFTGVVVTDALEMKAVSATLGMGEAAVQAIAAGVDLLCLGAQGLESQLAEVRDALLAAVESGRLPAERVLEAAGRIRELAEWARSPLAGDADPSFGLDVARRAVRVSGDPLLRGPVAVVEIRAPGSIAVSDTAWGITTVLAAADPRTTALRVTEELTDASGLLAPYSDRQVVAVYRDAHLSDWRRASLAAVRAARPDAILVSMGGADDLPGAGDEPAAVLRTLGSARVNAIAAAERLLGRELGV
ncbi:MAG: beta-N-acetylhexosaminidase [Cryptosporangiaceae bacterium]|nr:beta-N-acetylhexosaminidase [Cryptosporangiaceae bacterium]